MTTLDPNPPTLDIPTVEQNTHQPQVQPARLWMRKAVPVILAGLLGAVGGFAASGLHPGPQGKQGQQGLTGAPGPQGVQGTQGLQGPAGTAAQLSSLGVCFNTNYQYNNGTSWITSVNVSSPSRQADGTNYCPVGQYVPVVPQTAK